MLAKEQYIGAVALAVIALTAWIYIALTPQPALTDLDTPDLDSLRAVRDSLRRDSIRQVREARWQHYKDSCRQADDARFAAWNAERKARYDSFFLADSLWRDSMGIVFPRHRKKDTILNLNTADTAELVLIRGIGPYKARRILAYREELGGFYSPVQLCDERLRDLHLDTLTGSFTASPDSLRTIDVNTSDAETLSRHPYLRYSQAKAIYRLRRKYVRLESIDDLRSVPDLDSATLSRLQYYLRFE